jgi:ankyrin repeat protein
MQVIHLACQNDHSPIVKLLVDHGADIDALENKRWTPLMIAAMNGNFEVVKTLTKEGANKGIEDIEGKTAREHAIESLEQETRKAQQDLKIKKKIADLQRLN